MDQSLPRRRFLQSASAIGLGAGLGPWPALGAITPEASEMRIGPEAVRFRPEIEPVVRWIEDSPRETIFAKAAAELKSGLSYRDLLAGLFLAGIRSIKPRPVGFKFHAVLSMNSAHVMAQSAAPEERLFPMFWALDNFKNSQAQDVKEGDWTLSRLDEAKLPKPTQAKAAFLAAMDRWDAEAADLAIASLCRTAGAGETIEALWHYAVRDQRNIGHKPIFVAQSWRTLQAIGWEHAEPVLRSVVYGILDLQGDTRPIPVGPYDSNVVLAKSIREGWSVGKADPAATSTLLEILRHVEPSKASAEVAALLNRGVDPTSLWDAVILAGSELLVQNPGIIALHAVTAANSLHYIYGAAADETTRKLALLQAAGWIPLYRDRIKPRPDLLIDKIEPDVEGGKIELDGVLELVGRDRLQGAKRALGYLAKGGTAETLFAALRKLIVHKGRDSHDYKYGIAAWEECLHASDQRWQAPLAVASLFQLPSINVPDNPLLKRAREAIGNVIA